MNTAGANFSSTTSLYIDLPATNNIVLLNSPSPWSILCRHASFRRGPLPPSPTLALLQVYSRFLGNKHTYSFYYQSLSREYRDDTLMH